MAAISSMLFSPSTLSICAIRQMWLLEFFMFHSSSA
jgi:hypothetical protein